MNAVANVFRLSNLRGFQVPNLTFAYQETDTDAHWHISTGGTRCYLVRYGDEVATSDETEATDSHFMIRRVTSTLVLAGLGLYEATAMGRILFTDVGPDVTWATHLNHPTPRKAEPDEAVASKFYDWLHALVGHSLLRRAADDAHLALSHPHEALVYVYRGLEWLVTGEGRSWDELAADLGTSKKNIRDFKKLANHETGVRHADKSGLKLRADLDNYGTWVCALIDAINCTRGRLESGFTPMTPHEVADAVATSVVGDPYP